MLLFLYEKRNSDIPLFYFKAENLPKLAKYQIFLE
jgi:hypothetical protein